MVVGRWWLIYRRPSDMDCLGNMDFLSFEVATQGVTHWSLDKMFLVLFTDLCQAARCGRFLFFVCMNGNCNNKVFRMMDMRFFRMVISRRRSIPKSLLCSSYVGLSNIETPNRRSSGGITQSRRLLISRGKATWKAIGRKLINFETPSFFLGIYTLMGLLEWEWWVTM